MAGYIHTKGESSWWSKQKSGGNKNFTLASPSVGDERYVDWRETLKDKPADEQEEEDDGIGNYGIPGICLTQRQ